MKVTLFIRELENPLGKLEIDLQDYFIHFVNIIILNFNFPFFKLPPSFPTSEQASQLPFQYYLPFRMLR